VSIVTAPRCVPKPAFAAEACGRHAGVVLAQTGFFRLRFSAEPIELAFFRAGLNRWLLGLEWPDADREDAVLAINEACDNSVRQAWLRDGGGEVEVIARLVIGTHNRRIVAVVRDHGPSPTFGSGGGPWLTMVKACMDRVQIRPADGGTSVTMTSRPVALLDASLPTSQRL
jgi:anti-sigma regulatory factor (Ser/Thr protein kinase)